MKVALSCPCVVLLLWHNRDTFIGFFVWKACYQLPDGKSDVVALADMQVLARQYTQVEIR